MERGDVPYDTSPLYFCLEKFAEGTCIQENSNKVWFSLHLIVPLASPYATDGSTAARIEEKVD